MKKKTGPAAVEIKSVEELENFKKSGEVVSVAAYKDGDEFQGIYVSIATTMDDISFGFIGDENLANEVGIKFPGLTIYTNEPKTINFEGELTKEEVTSFVQKNSMPVVIEFDDNTARKIFNPKAAVNQHIMLFTKDDKYEEVKKVFIEVANQFQGQLYFIHVPEKQQRLYDYMGINKDELPSLIAVRVSNGNKKYKFEENELSVENIKTFCDNFLNGKLTIFLKSEDIPEKQEGAVYVYFILFIENCW